MNNNSTKEKEIKDCMKFDLEISLEGKKYVKLNIVLGKNKNVGIINQQPKESLETMKIECVDNMKCELRTDDLFEELDELQADNLKSEESNNMNSKNVEEEVYEDFYDLLDKNSQDLWDEIFDRTIELEIEGEKHNEEATLLLNCESVDIVEVQCFLASEYIDCIEKADDDTYEILIGDETFTIEFI